MSHSLDGIFHDRFDKLNFGNELNDCLSKHDLDNHFDSIYSHSQMNRNYKHCDTANFLTIELWF